MDLDLTFGMVEMEEAAEIIISKALLAGTWLVGTIYQDMLDALQQAGFIQLIYHRWLQCGYHKRPFYVTQEFVDRINERHSHLIQTLPKIAPTYQEISDSQCGFPLTTRLDNP